MNKEYYYIYCKGILGVKTNDADFRWVYGSVAPQSSYEEYEKCVVKFDLRVKPEKELDDAGGCDKCFQAYTWNSRIKTLYCRRVLFGHFKIGFNIRIDGKMVYAEIGRNYYRLVRNRIMNLHGMYYLLADLANMILLKNGFLSLYASAVYCEPNNRCTVFFAPPNTGKTLTASKLCSLGGYKLVGEDIVITDTEKVYSCPWTSSYRKSSSVVDDSGALGRIRKNADMDRFDVCDLTDIVVLSLGEARSSDEKQDVFQSICILNGYLFDYYSSPIVKILAYFDEEYRKDWNNCAESMIKDMVESCNSRSISMKAPMEFYEIVASETTGK